MTAEDSLRARPRAEQLRVDPSTQRKAALLPGFIGLVYPEALRARAVEGTVLAMVVVNADGTPDLPSFKLLRSDHPLFTEAVKNVLATAHVASAIVNGKPVRQLWQFPFEFKTSRR